MEATLDALSTFVKKLGKKARYGLHYHSHERQKRRRQHRGTEQQVDVYAFCTGLGSSEERSAVTSVFTLCLARNRRMEIILKLKQSLRQRVGREGLFCASMFQSERLLC